ncbi:hypothetical protein F5Y19DRAFT_493076 [Xylariaceae sp. FL1651]|nr:hypothetical protein F5Y19DRAFT_493076 [Xylariaceae sp. FL1651]
MAKRWLKDYVFRPSLEGLGVLDPTETFPDWKGDPEEDQYDSTKINAQSEINEKLVNQSNVDESSHQVKLIKNIFRNAEQVVVWLGRSEDHTENTFALLDALAKESESSKNGKLSTEKEVQLSSDQEGRIEAIVEQTWFKRSWTVQEILLARKYIVVSGWQSVNWDALSQGNIYASAMERFWSPERKLLARFRTRSATDPRDRIYAFLGLISNSTKLGIVTNYRISVEDLYRNVAAELIIRSQSLTLLKFLPLSTYQYDWRIVQKGQPREERSIDASEKYGMNSDHGKGSESHIRKDPNGGKPPSWTPDWERTEDIATPFDDGHGHEFGAPYSTNPTGFSDITTSEDRTTLIVSGYVFDTIREITEILPAITDLGVMGDEPYKHENSENQEEKGVRQLFKEGFEQIDYAVRELYKLIWPLETLVRWEKFAGLPPKAADKEKAYEALVNTYWQTLCAGALLPSGFEETRRSFWTWYRTMDPIRNWQQK